MQTLKITKEMLDADNFYIGATDLSAEEYDGHIEIAAKLGRVRFKLSLRAKGSIVAEAGSGISAGWGISAGGGISAGFSIICKAALLAKLRIFAGLCMFRVPRSDEMEIRCKRLERGKVCFGTLIEEPTADAAQPVSDQPAP